MGRAWVPEAKEVQDATICWKGDGHSILGSKRRYYDMTSFPDLGPGIAASVPSLRISEKGVQKILKGLNPHKATGPDQISLRFLKEMASTIAPFLTLIYQASHDQGQTPDDWKGAFITPLFKKGDKSKPSNYRPISRHQSHPRSWSISSTATS